MPRCLLFSPLRLSRPWLMAGAAALLWASTAWVGAHFPTVSAAGLTGFRMSLGGLALAVWIGPARLILALRQLPKVVTACLALGLGTFQWGYFAATQLGGGLWATWMTVALPVWLAAYLSSQPLAIRSILLLAGLSLIGPLPPAMAWGAALLSALSYTGYTLCLARAPDGLAATAIAMLVGSLPFWSESLAVLVQAGEVGMGIWGLACYLGLIATALAYALFARAVTEGSPTVALSALVLQPLFVILLDGLGHDGMFSISASLGSLLLTLFIVWPTVVRPLASRFSLTQQESS